MLDQLHLERLDGRRRVLPCRTVLTRAENVAGPAMPSAPSPRDCWKAVTAALVPLPKSPSAVVE